MRFVSFDSSIEDFTNLKKYFRYMIVGKDKKQAVHGQKLPHTAFQILIKTIY